MKFTYSLLLAVSLVSGPVLSDTANEKGLAIIKQADERDTGWVDRRVDIKMTLRNAQGQENIRHISNRSLEVEDDGDKSLTIFNEPRDVKGTAFLSYTHATEPDDQWLFLPALKRVKRVSSANKSGPFMGSEFAYEDISSQEVDKYEYRYLREDEIDGHEVHVIEYFPRYEHSGYSKLVTWMDKKLLQPRKTEYFDKKGDLLKTLVMTQYQEYLGKYWRPDLMEMVNHQTNKSTTMEWTNNKFQTGLASSDFNRNALKRIR